MTQDVLFHYCSTDTFVSIVSNGNIRLSSLSASNDWLEGDYVQSVFRKMAKSNPTKYKNPQGVLAEISSLPHYFRALGLCLSTEGDQLSQWRGYADDSHGVAIGLKTEYLDSQTDSKELHYQKMADKEGGVAFSRFGEVHYDEVKQISEIEPAITAISEAIDAGGLSVDWQTRHTASPEVLKAWGALQQARGKLMRSVYFIKSPAFYEENEWRFVRHDTVKTHTRVAFRAKRDSLLPFAELSLNWKEQPIAKVVLGPKHKTPIRDVEDFLEYHNYRFVDITTSGVSYR